ncbi:hypothetical protein HFP15_04165 [Amycolatopsis sp. K13G38]|uniref:PRC-barrel domain containing protein n=1 Tax=Amycolatopsis acididurans TaxID=2724524 RepID=A0ABX1IX50_9PSEU|nr:hypothetical protein [Amycolatopsis acididurans]NKQ52071.1 hypothetical protein [Amycolatopsis acididurans]
MRGVWFIGRGVVDRDGRNVGYVHDLVFRIVPGDPPRFELVGLECGKAGVGDRLGYTRDTMAGPWPLTALFRWLSRRSRFVEWSAVRRIGRERIEISKSRDELERFTEISS